MRKVEGQLQCARVRGSKHLSTLFFYRRYLKMGLQVQGPHGPLLLLHPGYVEPYRKPHRLPELPGRRARGDRDGDGQGPPVLHG